MEVASLCFDNPPSDPNALRSNLIMRSEFQERSEVTRDTRSAARDS